MEAWDEKERKPLVTPIRRNAALPRRSKIAEQFHEELGNRLEAVPGPTRDLLRIYGFPKQLSDHETGFTVKEAKIKILQSAWYVNLESNQGILCRPDSVGELEADKLVNVRVMVLRRNSIRKIPRVLTKFEFLTHLDLAKNNFQVLPTWWELMPSLRVLYLHDNQIIDEKEVANLEGLKQLETLSFEGNPFMYNSFENVQEYRLFVLHYFKNLKILDDHLVVDYERLLLYRAGSVLPLKVCAGKSAQVSNFPKFQALNAYTKVSCDFERFSNRLERKLEELRKVFIVECKEIERKLIRKTSVASKNAAKRKFDEILTEAVSSKRKRRLSTGSVQGIADEAYEILTISTKIFERKRLAWLQRIVALQRAEIDAINLQDLERFRHETRLSPLRKIQAILRGAMIREKIYQELLFAGFGFTRLQAIWRGYWVRLSQRRSLSRFLEEEHPELRLSMQEKKVEKAKALISNTIVKRFVDKKQGKAAKKVQRGFREFQRKVESFEARIREMPHALELYVLASERRQMKEMNECASLALKMARAVDLSSFDAGVLMVIHSKELVCERYGRHRMDNKFSFLTNNDAPVFKFVDDLKKLEACRDSWKRRLNELQMTKNKAKQAQHEIFMLSCRMLHVQKRKKEVLLQTKLRHRATGITARDLKKKSKKSPIAKRGLSQTFPFVLQVSPPGCVEDERKGLRVMALFYLFAERKGLFLFPGTNFRSKSKLLSSTRDAMRFLWATITMQRQTRSLLTRLKRNLLRDMLRLRAACVIQRWVRILPFVHRMQMLTQVSKELDRLDVLCKVSASDSESVPEFYIEHHAFLLDHNERDTETGLIQTKARLGRNPWLFGSLCRVNPKSRELQIQAGVLSAKTQCEFKVRLEGGHAESDCVFRPGTRTGLPRWLVAKALKVDPRSVFVSDAYQICAIPKSRYDPVRCENARSIIKSGNLVQDEKLAGISFHRITFNSWGQARLRAALFFARCGLRMYYVEDLARKNRQELDAIFPSEAALRIETLFNADLAVLQNLGFEVGRKSSVIRSRGKSFHRSSSFFQRSNSMGRRTSVSDLAGFSLKVLAKEQSPRKPSTNRRILQVDCSESGQEFQMEPSRHAKLVASVSLSVPAVEEEKNENEKDQENETFRMGLLSPVLNAGWAEREEPLNTSLLERDKPLELQVDVRAAENKEKEDPGLLSSPLALHRVQRRGSLVEAENRDHGEAVRTIQRDLIEHSRAQIEDKVQKKNLEIGVQKGYLQENQESAELKLGVRGGRRRSVIRRASVELQELFVDEEKEKQDEGIHCEKEEEKFFLDRPFPAEDPSDMGVLSWVPQAEETWKKEDRKRKVQPVREEDRIRIKREVKARKTIQTANKLFMRETARQAAIFRAGLNSVVKLARRTKNYDQNEKRKVETEQKAREHRENNARTRALYLENMKSKLEAKFKAHRVNKERAEAELSLRVKCPRAEQTKRNLELRSPIRSFLRQRSENNENETREMIQRVRRKAGVDAGLQYSASTFRKSSRAVL